VEQREDLGLPPAALSIDAALPPCAPAMLGGDVGRFARGSSSAVGRNGTSVGPALTVCTPVLVLNEVWFRTNHAVFREGIEGGSLGSRSPQWLS
jgi:hypothetical protein